MRFIIVYDQREHGMALRYVAILYSGSNEIDCLATDLDRQHTTRSAPLQRRVDLCTNNGVYFFGNETAIAGRTYASRRTLLHNCSEFWTDSWRKWVIYAIKSGIYVSLARVITKNGNWVHRAKRATHPYPSMNEPVNKSTRQLIFTRGKIDCRSLYW